VAKYNLLSLNNPPSNIGGNECKDNQTMFQSLAGQAWCGCVCSGAVGGIA